MSTQSSRGLPQLIMWSPIQSSLGLPLSNHVVCHAVITWPLTVITWFLTVIMWPPTQSSCGLPRSNHMPPPYSLCLVSHAVIPWPHSGHHLALHWSSRDLTHSHHVAFYGWQFAAEGVLHGHSWGHFYLSNWGVGLSALGGPGCCSILQWEGQILSQ